MIRKCCEEDDDDGLYMFGFYFCWGLLNVYVYVNNVM